MKNTMGSLLISVFLLSFVLPKSGYNLGDVVEDFSLKNIDGKMVSLSSFKDNKGLIVIFDCNTCPYRKAYNGRILALSKKYETDFPVIAINANDPEQSPGDSFEEMVILAKDKGYTFPYLFDETQKVAKTFGATNTPHVFILTKSGAEYRVAYIGTIDDNPRNASRVSKRYIEVAIDAYLVGAPIPITQTKAVGCGIRWK